MKIGETPDDQRDGKVEYIGDRWKQLHELEIKRGDTVLNYLFLVSGGAAAATLTYIGNATKESIVVPVGAIWMLGFFACSLLLVGLIKIRLIYHVSGIFKSWRQLVAAYYSNSIGWTEMVSQDEVVVNKNNWIIHVLGWLSFSLLCAGVFIGFVKLQEGTSRVRNEKASIAAQDSGYKAGKDSGSGVKERSVFSGETEGQRRGCPFIPSAAAAEEKVVVTINVNSGAVKTSSGVSSHRTRPTNCPRTVSRDISADDQSATFKRLKMPNVEAK